MKTNLLSEFRLFDFQNISEFTEEPFVPPSRMIGAYNEAEISEFRDKIVEEALTWIKTPYVSGQMVKGAGADCLTFLAGVYINVGLIPADVKIPFYRPDFMLHEKTESYLSGLLGYGHEIKEPKKGDVVLYHLKGAAIFCHSGLIVEWPKKIIHCKGHGVFPAHGEHGGFGACPRKFLSVF